jgi:hypothetical protein
MHTSSFRSRLLLAAVATGALTAFATRATRPSRAEPALPTADRQSLLSTADAVLKDMSGITGLPIKAPLKKQIVSREEIKTYLTQSLNQEITPRELRQQEAMLKVFGLVSSDFDLGKFLVTFYTEQAAGIYDPRRQAMLIADWVSPDMQKIVLAHELTHALQDQSFDLEKFQHAVRDDDDATSARQAVTEGYATAAMMEELIKPATLASLPSLEPLMNMMIQQPMAQFPAFSSAPFFLRFSALFPYSQGIGFMQAGLKHGGWKGLNSLFLRPPSTTREIFEPDLYFGSTGRTTGLSIVGSARPSPSPAESAPPKMTLPQKGPLSALPGLSFLGENVMGELGYYCLLGQLISEEEAKKLAPAWLADRYLLYQNSSTHQYALVARTRWTSPETALAFFRDYHTILAKKFTELAPDPRSGADVFVGRAASGEVILVRKGDECRWAEGVPNAQADAMLRWLESL